MAAGEKRGREEDENEDCRSEGVPKSRNAEVGQSSGSQASNSRPSVVGESSSSLASADFHTREDYECVSAMLELMLRCPICRAYFPSTEALNHHLKSHKRWRLSASGDRLVRTNYTGKVDREECSIYYICAYCGRQFNSFLGLSGHRTSCKSAEEKKKKEEEKKEEEDTLKKKELDDMLELTLGNSFYVMKETRRHRCPICPAVFSLRPTLDAHMINWHRDKAAPSGDRKEEEEDKAGPSGDKVEEDKR